MPLSKIGRRATSAAIAAAPVVGAMLIQAFVDFQNKALTVTEYEVRSKNVPATIDGFRIAQVSDLHDAEFGFQNERLIEAVRQSKPDLIAITGDLIHGDTIANAMAFVRHAVSIAPVVFSPGNHEPSSTRYPELRAQMMASGAIVLEDGVIGDAELGIAPRSYLTAPSLTVVGMADQLFSSWLDRSDPESLTQRKLDELIPEAEEMEGTSSRRLPGRRPFRVLLAHRPELISSYAREGIDLVLAGHAHGGQWRVPGIGGLYAPSQGIFPKYDSGVHMEGDTAMVVSRGLGNSGFPLRLNNRPELVVVTLRSDGIGSDVKEALASAAASLPSASDALGEGNGKRGKGRGRKVRRPRMQPATKAFVKETAKTAVMNEVPEIAQQIVGALATVAISALVGKNVLGKGKIG